MIPDLENMPKMPVLVARSGYESPQILTLTPRFSFCSPTIICGDDMFSSYGALANLMTVTDLLTLFTNR
jgi:hypothetical protein